MSFNLFDKPSRRYKLILIILCLVGLYIIGTAANTMFTHGAYWAKVKEKLAIDSINEAATRGNLYSCDGQLLVSTLPVYKIEMDFVAQGNDSTLQAWRDSAFNADIDSISDGLTKIFPDKSAKWFKDRLQKGKRERKRSLVIYPKDITYIQYMACKKLPLFRENKNKGGFHCEVKMYRKKFYGSLASRTLGDVYRDSDAAKSGLEWCYDTLLRGKDGWSHIAKTLNRHPKFIDVPPVNGHDLVTTIDIRMQDIAEAALIKEMKEPTVNAEKGVAILMEVATGDVKALVSMTHIKDSVNGIDGYYEIQNDAVNALWEPGSTFKTGSMMVAMEDGYITPDYTVDTGNGVCEMHGRQMKDHNWTRGGYGTLSVTQVLEYSSNIGVSKIIDHFYGNNPEKYVQGLYNIGVGIPLGLPMGADPRVRMPKKEGNHWANWSKTTLPWMSIGYETQIPPISTLAFYNAIANNGKMVRPRFVKSEMVDGQVVKEFPVEVIKEKICSDKTLHNIQDILEKVVSEGLGRAAGNGGKLFKVSGKTGTAQFATSRGYQDHMYMVSFCGYFPSDNPKYSCIVCIQKRGLPASGGSQCGPVFREISQLVMSEGEYRSPEQASDSTSKFTPFVTSGNMRETRDLLKLMHLPWQSNSNSYAWGTARIDTTSQKLRLEQSVVSTDVVPNVKNMGARDAVYALQASGLKVRVKGVGRVREQSIPAGTRHAKGRTITINLR